MPPVTAYRVESRAARAGLRVLIVSVFGAILMPVLAACVEPGRGQPAISFMVFGDAAELAAYQNLVEAFEGSHPTIDVQLRHIPDQADYRRRLATDFSAGGPPDVMLLNYRRFAAFAQEGGLEPLGPYLSASTSIESTDFYHEAMAAFQLRGQLWCIPQNISSLVVYYNQDLFEAAGLAYPADDWTWDDFLAAARRLTRDLDGDEQVDQYGLGLEPSLYRLAPFVWQAGGELVDDPVRPNRLALDSPEASAAFQWFVDLQVREQVVPSAIAEAAESSQSRFLNGRLGMILNSRRGVPTYRTIKDFVWDVAPLPRARQAAGILHSDGYCLAAQSQHKDAAWSFIEFANSPVGQAIVARSGRTVPSLRAVAESPVFLDPAQPPARDRVFLDTIPLLRTVPGMPSWAGIEELASGQVEAAFYGRASIQQANTAIWELTKPFFGP